MKRKKFLSLVIASVFWLNGTLPAFAASFADIKQVPWSGAETYINKVADAGLMIGDTNAAGQKVFRPRDSITYCEVAQLAYTLLSSYYGTQATADMQSKYASTLQAFSVPSWAYPACAYCLEKGALQISDLSYFMQNTSKGTSANAVRENVALIFGRALSNLVAVNNSSSLSFKDAAAISSATVPYLDLLVRTGVITGDSAGNFNPKNTINRSEMAVIVSKTSDYLSTLKGGSATGVISGSIESITTSGAQKQLTIRSGSTTKTLLGRNSTPCLENGSAFSFSSLKTGDQVTVSYQGQNISSVIRLSSSTTPGNTVSGTYVGMNNSVINVDVGGRTFTYNLSNDVAFVLGGFSVNLTNMIASAEYGDRITLTLNSNNEIIKAVITLKSNKYDVKGYYKDISTSYISLKKTKSSSSATKYYFENNDSSRASFYIDGRLSTYSKFKDKVSSGDEVELVYNSKEEVIEVRLSAEDDYDEEGYFASMTDSSISIKSSKSSSADKYYFEDDDYDNVDFYINGSSRSYSKFKDAVEKNDKIGLVTTSKDRVTKVYLIDEDDDYDEEGYFASMSDSSISIKSSKSSSADKYYFEDKDYDNVDFYINGSSKSYSKFENAVGKNDKIGLVLNRDDKVTKVYLIDSSDDTESDLEGYFVSIDKNGKYLYFKESKSGSEKKYYFEDEKASNASFYMDKESTSFSKFKYAAQENDKLELVLNSDDEIIKVYLTISSEEELSGKLTSLSSSKLKLSGSKAYSLAAEKDLTIKVKDGSDTTISTLDELDDAFNEDSKIIEVELVINADDEVSKITGYVSELAGKLRSIDTRYEKLKVRGDSGTSVTYTCASSCSVKLASSRYSDDLEGLEDAFDDDKDIDVTLVLNSSGKITSIRADW